MKHQHFQLLTVAKQMREVNGFEFDAARIESLVAELESDMSAVQKVLSAYAAKDTASQATITAQAAQIAAQATQISTLTAEFAAAQAKALDPSDEAQLTTSEAALGLDANGDPIAPATPAT